MHKINTLDKLLWDGELRRYGRFTDPAAASGGHRKQLRQEWLRLGIDAVAGWNDRETFLQV
jgi:hypothetical protein